MDEVRLRAALTGLSPSALDECIREAHQPNRTVLWNQIVGSRTSPPIPEVVHWFHATRVPPHTDFRRDGIQPLGPCLPMIKDFLKTLARELRLPPPGPSANQTGGARQYRLKANDRMYWGPCAFLVRDAIVQRESPTHDYLASPEIVEDLAQMIAREQHVALLIEKFQERTRRCIVKFRSTEPRKDVAEVALYYCYSSLWLRGQSRDTNTTSDGNARTIPPSDIVGIEYF